MTTPHRPWSPHPPAHYQEPSRDPQGVENYLAQAHQNPGYYDPYAAWQPAASHPAYTPGRQSSLPPNSHGYNTNGYGVSHQHQPTDASFEALDLAEYHSRLNAQQHYALPQPQVYIPPPPQPGYYSHSVPYPAAETSHSAVTQVQSPARDFIDIGPFTYSGIRETSPPPVRPPPASSPRRRQTKEHVTSPVHSPPPRSHLPWASEGSAEHPGDPDPVFPPSSPHRNDSNSFPFNVQSARSAETATSETAHSPGDREGETAHLARDVEADGEKNWGVREGEGPGDIGVDGKLISNGPRKRMAVRALQVLAAIGTCVACIYAFAVPKPNPAAPPASKPAVYVIVVLGFITLLAFGYIYIIRGCFGVGVKDDDPYSHPMVLPISRHRAGHRGRKNKKGQDNIQVNLVVDPSYFTPKGESGITPGVPWSSQQGANSSGVFTSYERERARLSARKGLWWALGLDVLAAIVWGAAFVLAMIGPRCPVGGYSGWCDAFNGAVACACIGCVLFLTSGVLVGRDLMVSRKSERKLGGR